MTTECRDFRFGTWQTDRMNPNESSPWGQLYYPDVRSMYVITDPAHREDKVLNQKGHVFVIERCARGEKMSNLYRAEVGRAGDGARPPKARDTGRGMRSRVEVYRRPPEHSEGCVCGISPEAEGVRTQSRRHLNAVKVETGRGKGAKRLAVKLHIDDGCLGGGGNINKLSVTSPFAENWYTYDDWRTNLAAKDFYAQSYYKDYFQSNPNRENVFTYCLMVDIFGKVHLKDYYDERDTKYELSTVSLTKKAFLLSGEKFIGNRFYENFIYQLLQHSGPDPLANKDDDFLNDWSEIFYGTEVDIGDTDGDHILDGHDREPLKKNRRFAFIVEQDPEGDGRVNTVPKSDTGEIGYDAAYVFKKANFDLISLISNIDYKDEWYGGYNYGKDLHDWGVKQYFAERIDTTYIETIPFTGYYAVDQWGINERLDRSIEKVKTETGYGINTPPNNYGEDIIVVFITGHGYPGGLMIQKDEDGKKIEVPITGFPQFTWRYKTGSDTHDKDDYYEESDFSGDEYDIKNWVDKFGSGVRSVFLASCFSENAFDRWNNGDDNVVIGGREKVSWEPQDYWEGTTYNYDFDDIGGKYENEKKRKIDGINRESMEFLWTYIIEGQSYNKPSPMYAIEDNYCGDLYLC